MAGIYYRRPETRSMKKHWLLCSVFAAGLTLGNLLPAHWLASPVDAAPADVRGSANVAVDSYKNVEDTYTLWSDGSITDSLGVRVNESTQYSPAPAAAGLKSATPKAKAVSGSPNVAVCAIPRGDMTLIMFSDGTYKLPQNGGAGAGASAPVQLYTGHEKIWVNGQTIQNGRTYAANDDYKLETDGIGRWKLTFSHNVKRGRTATMNYNVFAHQANHQLYTTIPLAGQSSDGGKTWLFDIAGQYTGYNPADSWPNMVDFQILGD